jgi:hypothetical protein
MTEELEALTLNSSPKKGAGLTISGSIPLWQIYSPHPPTPSPKKGEGEPDSKSLSRPGRGI